MKELKEIKFSDVLQSNQIDPRELGKMIGFNKKTND